jgi:hypothetical protein
VQPDPDSADVKAAGGVVVRGAHVAVCHRPRYWLMEPQSGAFAPNEEVDEMRWVTPAEAEALVSYEHDRALARAVRA